MAEQDNAHIQEGVHEQAQAQSSKHDSRRDDGQYQAQYNGERKGDGKSAGTASQADRSTDRQTNNQSKSGGVPPQNGKSSAPPSQTGASTQGSQAPTQTQSQTTHKKPSEMSALDRLKHIQQNFKTHWKGINCEYSGRPGTSNFVNRKRMFTISECSIQEEERQRQLGKCMMKLKELEDECKGIMPNGSSQASINGSTTITNRTVNSSMSGTHGNQGFFNSNAGGGTNATGYYNNNGKNQSDFLVFKNITEKQLVTNNMQFNGYQKSYHIENSELLYKMLRFDNKLIRSVLEAGGFAPTESHEWNILWSSSSCKSYLYEGLNEYQKINHFPQSHEITRKDRLCFNIVRMQERYGKQHFDFVPDTYILPDEFGEFYEHYQKLKQHDSKKNIWIVKPANAAQGRGIQLIDDINDVNVDELSVISRYVTNPLLINGHKFDLRIYVLVTSYEPLRVYVFQEGLARFASETYTSKINKTNKYMHLTNYSINKKNEKFIKNENCEQDDFGYKWSLGAFCRHLEQVGIDMNLLWSRCYDVIIKTILCGENYVQNAMKKNGTHRTNCFEILGFDILVDSDLKPWLLEVNLSPSLACDSPLDMSIKSNLVCDAFNLMGVKRFDRKKESLNKIKHRMKGLYNKGKKANNLGSGIQGTGITPNGGLSSLGSSDIYGGQSSHQVQQTIDRFVNDNPVEYSAFLDPLKKAANLKYKDYVRETIIESQRRGYMLRIYPARNSDMYDPFFQHQRPYNKVIYKVLYGDEILKNYGKLAIFSQPNAGETKLNYDMKLPPTSYEQYKKLNAERQSASASGQSKGTRQIQSASNKERERTMGLQGVHGGMQNAVDQKTPQQQNRNQDANSTGGHGPSGRPQTGHASSSHAHSAHGGSQKMAQGSSQQHKSSSAGPQKEGTQSEKPAAQGQQQEKVLITGDDILIEYVDRLMNQLKIMNDEGMLQDAWKRAIEKFITHYVWHSQDRRKVDGPIVGIIERLEGRLHEMQERRRRLIKYLYKKEGKLDEFEEGFHQSISKKSTIIKKFSSIQLEDLLRTSTKNVAQEVVSSLIPPQGGLGVLAQVEKFCQQNSIAQVSGQNSSAGQNAASSTAGGTFASGSSSQQAFNNNRFNETQTAQSQHSSYHHTQSASQQSRNVMGAAQMGSGNQPHAGGLGQGVPKQRLKSASMNKRIPRGFSRENHDEPGSASQYDHHDGASNHMSHVVNQQQYHGYTGHLSNTGMPPVNSSGNIGNNTLSSQHNSGYVGYMGGSGNQTRQSKTSSGVRQQTWLNQTGTTNSQNGQQKY